MQLITCQAMSSTHISQWHNQLASISGHDTLILKNEMIKISQLDNKSYVNENLRFLNSEEKLLDIFHLFDQKKLQCLLKAEFILANYQTTCFELQVIQLSDDFSIEYQGQVLSEKHITAHVDLIASTWMDEYQFDNLPRSILQDDDTSQFILHPILDTLLISPAGNISIEKVSLLTAGTLVFFLLCCSACLYKYKGLRDCLYKTIRLMGTKIYECFTTKSHRTKKENKILRKDLAQ